MSEAAQSKSGLRVDDFDFHLPPELIAQQPPVERGLSRMLVMDRAKGVVSDSSFAELPSLLHPGDLLVLNDTRVIPARLYAQRTGMKPAPDAAQLLRAPSLRLLSGARVGIHEPTLAYSNPSTCIGYH